MAKIKLEDIKTELEKEKWQVISSSYKNLDTDMTFKCPEGHIVISAWKHLRNKRSCPVCKNNYYKEQEIKVIPKKKGVARVLALDQATHITGYSIFDNEELVYAGTFEATAEDEIERDVQIQNWLIQLVHNWKPDIIGLEGIQLQQFNDKMVGVTTYQTLARLQGILMATCHNLKVDYIVCPPATWRNHSGVKGRSRADKKRSMQNKIKEWFDITVSDDVADAIGIGKYVNETHKKKVEIFNWE